MPTLAVDAHVVSYEEYGAGPLVLLVHGSPGNGKAWSRVGEHLAERHRVVAPDLPGHGGTTPPAAGAIPDVGDTAVLIEALIGRVGVPALLVGYSYGGVVALAIALRGRVSIGALALLEPVAVSALGMIGDPDLHARTRAVFDGYIDAVEAGDPRQVRTMVDFWFGPGAFERMPEALRAYMVREAATNVRDVRGTLREAYAPATLRRIPVPVTTIVGGCSPDITRTIAQAITTHVPKASLAILDGATHAMITTHAQPLAETLAALARGAMVP
jgi:pimeloyl-ACP methyl ester carboxylesterase